MAKSSARLGGLLAGVVLVAACGSQATFDQLVDLLGGDGPVGGPSEDAFVPRNVACTPLEDFCEGTVHWTCTYSGKNAFGHDCTGEGTPTNPGTCMTTECGATIKACCGRQKNDVEWSFTAPATFSGHYNNVFAGQGYGSLSASCGEASGSVHLTVASTMACVPDTTTDISLTMSGLTAGQPVTLPSSNVSLSANQNAAGVLTSCTSWTGTATLSSEDPMAKVSIDATCSEMGKTMFKVVGSINSNK